jgi:hypothetical protein
MNFRCTLPLLRLPSGKQRRANYVAARRDAGLNERQAAVTLQRHIVLALEFLSLLLILLYLGLVNTSVLSPEHIGTRSGCARYAVSALRALWHRWIFFAVSGHRAMLLHVRCANCLTQRHAATFTCPVLCAKPTALSFFTSSFKRRTGQFGRTSATRSHAGAFKYLAKC